MQEESRMDETKKIKAADDIIFEKAGITIEKGGKKMNSIFHRVSIRKYTDQKIEEEKIMQMLRAAMAAPSACNQQPWEYYVVTNPEKKKNCRRHRRTRDAPKVHRSYLYRAIGKRG